MNTRKISFSVLIKQNKKNQKNHLNNLITRINNIKNLKQAIKGKDENKLQLSFYVIGYYLMNMIQAFKRREM